MRERSHLPAPANQKAPGQLGESESEIMEGRIESPPAFQLTADDDAPTDPGPPSEPGLSSAKPPQISLKASSPASPPTQLPVTNLQTDRFQPGPELAGAIDQAGAQGLDIPVCFGSMAKGKIRVKRQGAHYVSHDHRFCKLDLHHPALSPLQAIGAQAVLVFEIGEDQVIGGFVSLWAGGRVMEAEKLTDLIAGQASEFGWQGLGKLGSPSSITNEISGGRLNFLLEGMSVEIAGMAEGDLDYGFINEQIQFKCQGKIEVPRVSSGTIEIQRDKKGMLSGSVSLPIDMDHFSGSVTARYYNGEFDLQGKARYASEQFQGELNVMLADKEVARRVAHNELDPQHIHQEKAKAQNLDQAAAQHSGEKALAAWGEVDVTLSEGFEGKAKVFVDGEGYVTVQGGITPPSEIEMFPEKESSYAFPSLGARALYGIPLVGNLFVYANIGLELVGTIGPGRFHDIQVKGNYSTDPAIRNSLEIAGSMNISAYAGVRLKATGGAGIQLAGHDLKAGVSITALAGVRGYVDARPTVGYREKSPDQPGEFYLKGHLEMAGQPYLGLQGDLFVELDSPWWSPAPDQTWEWPLSRLDYPLPGGFGIGADLDYVLGSGEAPKLSFGEVDFSQDKFMSDVMENKAPKGMKNELQAQGNFQDQAEKKPPTTPKHKKSQQVQETRREGADPEMLEKQKEAMKNAKGNLKGQGQDDSKQKQDKQAKVAKEGEQAETMAGKQERLERALAEAQQLIPHTEEPKEVRSRLPKIKERYGLKYLRLVVDKDGQGIDLVHFEGKVNPEMDSEEMILITNHLLDRMETLVETIDKVEGQYTEAGPGNKAPKHFKYGEVKDGKTSKLTRTIAQEWHKVREGRAAIQEILDLRGKEGKRSSSYAYADVIETFQNLFKIFSVGKTNYVNALDAMVKILESEGTDPDKIEDFKKDSYPNASIRYFPQGWAFTKVRKALYDGLFRKQWNAKRKARKGDKQVLMQELQAIQKRWKDAAAKQDKPGISAAEADWQKYKDDGILHPKDLIGSVRNPDRAFKADLESSYSLDHKDPVTKLWNKQSKGWDAGDAEREQEYLEDSNLEWISIAKNSQKSNRDKSGNVHIGVLYIGPNFTSVRTDAGKHNKNPQKIRENNSHPYETFL